MPRKRHISASNYQGLVIFSEARPWGRFLYIQRPRPTTSPGETTSTAEHRTLTRRRLQMAAVRVCVGGHSPPLPVTSRRVARVSAIFHTKQTWPALSWGRYLLASLSTTSVILIPETTDTRLWGALSRGAASPDAGWGDNWRQSIRVRRLFRCPEWMERKMAPNVEFNSRTYEACPRSDVSHPRGSEPVNVELGKGQQLCRGPGGGRTKSEP